MKRAKNKRNTPNPRGKALNLYLDQTVGDRFGRLVEANPGQDKTKLANMCILKGLPEVERIMAELYQVPPSVTA